MHDLLAEVVSFDGCLREKALLDRDEALERTNGLFRPLEEEQGPGVTVELPARPGCRRRSPAREALSLSASGAQSLATAGMPGTSSSGAPDPRSS